MVRGTKKQFREQSHVQPSESLRCAAAPATSVDLSSTLSFACVRIFWRHPCAQLDRTGTRSVSTHFIQLPVTRFVECPIVCFRAHLLLCSCERDSPRLASVLIVKQWNRRTFEGGLGGYAAYLTAVSLGTRQSCEP